MTRAFQMPAAPELEVAMTVAGCRSIKEIDDAAALRRGPANERHRDNR